MQSLEADARDFLEVLRSERRDVISRLRQTRFSTLKDGYSQSQVIPYATYSPWLDDLVFQGLFEAVHDHTMVDIYRCYELYQLAKQSTSLGGEVVEVGVWRGGTAALVAAAASRRAIHLFDTFAGVAKADRAHDTLYSCGEHADTDRETVEALFRHLGLGCVINAGVFPDDSGGALPQAVAFAHIDVDTYSSAKQAFHTIWPRVEASGVVVFDDYGFFGCEGVTQAVGEIRTSTADAFFVHNLNGHALLIKKP